MRVNKKLKSQRKTANKKRKSHENIQFHTRMLNIHGEINRILQNSSDFDKLTARRSN